MTAAVRVHYGCGNAVGASWLNFDASPMLWVERIPVIGRALHAAVGGGTPFPRAVRYGNIADKPLVPDNTASAVYASHVLEHLSLQETRRALANTFRMMAPGGVFRLIVPDLRSRAELYIEQLRAGDQEASSNFMRYSLLGAEERPRGLIRPIRRAFSGSSHLWMWDSVSMGAELARCGFTQIRECQFGDAQDPAFGELEVRARFIDTTLQRPECAMEARKPRE
jgi:hypothetical protein